MPKINPANKKQITPTVRKQHEFEYVTSFDSQIPVGWRHRSTKWLVLNKACDKLLTGDVENVRVDVTKANGTTPEKAIQSIRSAVYHWFANAELDTTGFKVRTAKGLTEEDVPFLVAWLEEK